MHATTTAIFDGEAIRLDEPVALPPNTRLHVILWTEDEAEEERRYWSQLGAEAMSRLESQGEPEYTSADCI